MKPRETLDLSLDADGLTVAKMVDEELAYDNVRWDDVLMIVAYSQDCYTVDQVRLEVLAHGLDESILITEDDVGFSAFVADLGKYLKLDEPDWYAKLIGKPFNQQLYTVYKKESQ